MYVVENPTYLINRSDYVENRFTYIFLSKFSYFRKICPQIKLIDFEEILEIEKYKVVDVYV